MSRAEGVGSPAPAAPTAAAALAAALAVLAAAIAALATPGPRRISDETVAALVETLRDGSVPRPWRCEYEHGVRPAGGHILLRAAVEAAGPRPLRGPAVLGVLLVAASAAAGAWAAARRFGAPAGSATGLLLAAAPPTVGAGLAVDPALVATTALLGAWAAAERALAGDRGPAQRAWAAASGGLASLAAFCRYEAAIATLCVAAAFALAAAVRAMRGREPTQPIGFAGLSVSTAAAGAIAALSVPAFIAGCDWGRRGRFLAFYDAQRGTSAGEGLGLAGAIRAWTEAAALPLGPLLWGLAAMGAAFLLGRGPRLPLVWGGILAAFLVARGAGSTLAAEPRYALPLSALLAVLAGLGAGRISEERRRPLVLALALSAAGLCLAWPLALRTRGSTPETRPFPLLSAAEREATAWIEEALREARTDGPLWLVGGSNTLTAPTLLLRARLAGRDGPDELGGERGRSRDLAAGVAASRWLSVDEWKELRASAGLPAALVLDPTVPGALAAGPWPPDARVFSREGWTLLLRGEKSLHGYQAPRLDLLWFVAEPFKTSGSTRGR